MTITPTAPSITPCPVDWCPSAGVHEWERAEGVDPHRIHTLTVLDVKTADHSNSTATVEAEAYEREDGTLTPSVQIPYDPELYTWQQANQVIEAIRYAATTAFGAAPDERADMDEFDAATAELVERAGKPTDVNRLVAAAIRFRSAYLGA